MLDKGEEEYSQNAKDEDIKSNHVIPDIFRDVKDIPPVFTINSFNFTTKTDVKNCECVVDKNEIRKNSKLAFYSSDCNTISNDTKLGAISWGLIIENSFEFLKGAFSKQTSSRLNQHFNPITNSQK